MGLKPQQHTLRDKAANPTYMTGVSRANPGLAMMGRWVSLGLPLATLDEDLQKAAKKAGVKKLG